jgi:hypothetical protein
MTRVAGSVVFQMLLTYTSKVRRVAQRFYSTTNASPITLRHITPYFKFIIVSYCPAILLLPPVTAAGKMKDTSRPCSAWATANPCLFAAVGRNASPSWDREDIIDAQSILFPLSLLSQLISTLPIATKAAITV